MMRVKLSGYFMSPIKIKGDGTFEAELNVWKNPGQDMQEAVEDSVIENIVIEIEEVEDDLY